MRTIFKLALPLFFWVLIALAPAQAQRSVDMAVTSATVIPSPGVYPGAMNLSFNIRAETLPQLLSSNQSGISYAVVKITLSKLDGAPGGTMIMPTGPGADLFTWTYDIATKTYTGVSKDVLMNANQSYAIQIPNVPTTAVSTGDVGFRANLTPPANLRNSSAEDDETSTFTDTVLPVKLISFDASKENTIVQLNWASTEEVNSDHFEIQRSMNGKDWAAIGKVAAAGDTRAIQKYAFTDKAPSNGENLYRLKMIDRDETFAYSRIQSATFVGLAESDLSVYPNPTVDVLKIRDYSQVTKVSIFDMNGKAVLESGASKTGEISVHNLTSGMYLVRVSRANGLTSSQKIVVGK
jgi:hypothetical protein